MIFDLRLYAFVNYKLRKDWDTILNIPCELALKRNKKARHCRVCVWNFSREVKLVPRYQCSIYLFIFWTYDFGFVFGTFVLGWRIFLHFVSYLGAGGQGLQWWPCLTKLVTGGEAESDQLCVPAIWSSLTLTWWTLLKHWSWGFLLLWFVFQAVGAYSIKMEHSLSWTWHRTCYKSYPCVCVCRVFRCVCF